MSSTAPNTNGFNVSKEVSTILNHCNDSPIQKRKPEKDENPHVEIIIKNKESRLLPPRTEKQSEAKICGAIFARSIIFHPQQR